MDQHNVQSNTSQGMALWGDAFLQSRLVEGCASSIRNTEQWTRRIQTFPRHLDETSAATSFLPHPSVCPLATANHLAIATCGCDGFSDVGLLDAQVTRSLPQRSAQAFLSPGCVWLEKDSPKARRNSSLVIWSFGRHW